MICSLKNNFGFSHEFALGSYWQQVCQKSPQNDKTKKKRFAHLQSRYITLMIF